MILPRAILFLVSYTCSAYTAQSLNVLFCLNFFSCVKFDRKQTTLADTCARGVGKVIIS